MNLLKTIYTNVIANHQRGVSFIILVVFLFTFILSRTVVYLIDADILPDLYLFLGQTHVHHLNYGIFLLTISGYLGMVLPRTRHMGKLAAIFGIGLGLTFDEFSLWFHLNNSYYARISYEAIVVITLVLINIIYFGDIWQKLFWFITRSPKRF